MAVASITVNRSYPVGRHWNRQIAIRLSGSYPGTAGETIDFTTMLNTNKLPRGKFGGVAGSTKALPANDDIYIVRVPDGYDASLQQAAASPTLKNYVLHIFTTSDTELSSGAYAAGLTAMDIVIDVIQSIKYA